MRYTIQRAKHIEQRVTKLVTDEHIDKPGLTWQMKLDFQPTSTSGRDVLVLTNLCVGYGDHILLEDINRTIRFGARIILTGPNGSGKTTLLRTIAGKVIRLAGHVRLGAKVQLGYMTQEQEDLDTDKNVLDTLLHTARFTETEARLYLHRFLFTGDDVFLLVGSLSYGERSRLSLALLVASGCNFLLFDEPINHLDIPSRIRFEQALSTFEGKAL